MRGFDGTYFIQEITEVLAGYRQMEFKNKSSHKGAFSVVKNVFAWIMWDGNEGFYLNFLICGIVSYCFSFIYPLNSIL